MKDRTDNEMTSNDAPTLGNPLRHSITRLALVSHSCVSRLKEIVSVKISLAGILFAILTAEVQAVPWISSATGSAINATVIEPNPVVSTPALIVYLKNLNCERVGQESDAAIIASFTTNGYRVVMLDYTNHVNARSPFLNADVLKIRNEIGATTFPGSIGLVASKNKCYILCEGYRLMRNVPYYLNDPTIYNGSDSNANLRMDIAYPSQPSRAVPVVMEYSTSNSYQGNEDDRMNNGNAFTGTTDTILEGAPAAGIAWAMTDHPKYRAWGSPTLYSGFEVNPDTIKKVRSSVRVLREVGATLGLSGNIAIHGFSRGATAGSLAAGDLAVPTIDSAGYSTALSSRVQGVLLGSGIYDYSHAGGTITGDPTGTQVDIYNRFVTAWGQTAANLLVWQSQGAPYYMATTSTAPVFLSYNTNDAAWYVYQAQRLATNLATLGVPHQVATGNSGHKVTTNFTTLTDIYNFFKAHTNAPPNKPGATVLSNFDTNAQLLDLTINANGNINSVKYAIYTDSIPRQWIQSNGTAGSTAVWRTLADWGTPVRVGPLTNLNTVKFTVIAYHTTIFTTVQNSENVIAAPRPQINNISYEPTTGSFSFTWLALNGVTHIANLTDVIQRSTTLSNDWVTVLGATLTITNGTVTFTDLTPPVGKCFYRVIRP